MAGHGGEWSVAVLKTGKILITEKNIRSYIEASEGYEVSRPMFLEYLAMGLPVRIIKNKYHAHAENIDNFFRQITMRQHIEGQAVEEVE